MVAAIQASPCPMWVGWGPELSFFGNDACLALVGRMWEDSAGVSASTVLLEFWSALQDQVRAVIASGESSSVELSVGGGRDRSGMRLVRSHCSRLGAAAAEVGGVLCVFEPIGLTGRGPLVAAPVEEAAAESLAAPPSAGSVQSHQVCAGSGRGNEAEEIRPPRSPPPYVGSYTRLHGSDSVRVWERTGQLADARAFYEAVFDQEHFAGLLSLDGRVVDVNRAWIEATGFARDEIVGRLFWETGWWARSKGVQAWAKIGFAEALQGGRFRGESRFFTADGNERRIEITLTPVRRENGGMTCIVFSGHDVTDSHRNIEELRHADVARETEAQFRRMANAAPVLIWMADVENRGTWFNQQWLEFVGRPLERELAFGWLENVHADDVGRCTRVFCEAFRERRPFEVEFRLRRHDGEFRWILDHGVPVFAHDGSFAGYIGSCIDITERRQAEVTVQRLAAIVESSGDAILTVDLEGYIISWNSGAEALYGYSAVEILGQPVSVIIPVDRRAEDARQIARIVGGERVAHWETQRLHRDGHLLEVSVSMSPIRDATGAIVSVARIGRDISARIRAEAALRESEERFRMLADNIAQIAWTADRDGGIHWFNRRWFEFTGLDPDMDGGAAWREVQHHDHRDRVLGKFARCVADGVVWEDTFPLRRHDGEFRWFLARAVPIREDDGAVVQWFGTNTDITGMREIEKELERTRDEALEASRAKDDFLAALSHELRTPLNPVLLLASEAAEDPTLPAQVRADFAAVRKHVNLEARLIDDLLDLTRISRGMLALDLHDHDLHAILRDAIATVSGDVAEKSIALTVRFEADTPRVRGDAVRLQQAFWNVLKNAVKFTPAGGRITVISRPAEGGTVEIAVTDSGIGITEEELPRIFEAFAQGEHASRVAAQRFGGLGLGLTISRRIVEMHGGRVEAFSAGRGRGSSFVLTFPLRSAGRAPADAEPVVMPSADGEYKGRRVLLVEDHGPTRSAITRLLARRGFDVIASAGAAEARSAMREKQFDLLVSDIGLPDGNGCDLMRECADLRAVPGIALTGYGMEHDIARSHDAGFSSHLTKPISIQALDSAIAAALPARATSSSK